MPNATRPIIQVLASNNFSGKLSIKALANSKSLMVDNEAQSKYLQSDVEQGNELYYQDVIIVNHQRSGDQVGEDPDSFHLNLPFMQ